MPPWLSRVSTSLTAASVAWLFSCPLMKADKVLRVRGLESLRLRRLSATFWDRPGGGEGAGAGRPGMSLSDESRLQVMFWILRCLMSGSNPLSLETMWNVAAGSRRAA
jgi:hypothetical protein